MGQKAHLALGFSAEWCWAGWEILSRRLLQKTTAYVTNYVYLLLSL